MRTTVAAEPRSFDWHSGFIKTYLAQPFPPIAWERVRATNGVKWCDGLLLTWASKHVNVEKPGTNELKT
jgi:hypothetical protein